jgi:glycosyltransferase involved in cell wall biosynthesis
VLRHASRVICFNGREQRALEARLGARAVRMDHGVDAARLGSGQARRAAERWPALRRGPAVVVLGRLSEQKNQLLALRAFAEGAPAEAQLLLAGAETDQGYRERVDREAQALGVRGRVWFLGNLDAQEQVPDLLAAASVVLVPSTHEAFGIVVIEAWAAGVPTLFARSSGTEDLATALGVSEATPDGLEVRAWARSLGRLMGEEGLRRRLSEAGRVQVRQRFDRERVLDALAGLYREVLREHEGPGAAEGWS